MRILIESVESMNTHSIQKTFLNAISAAKDELVDPIEFATRAAGDYNKRIQAQVYMEYQRELKK